MKKTLLLLSFLFFLITQAKAQTSVYHPFPDSDAVWNMSRHSGHPILECAGQPMRELFSYRFTGDTIINSSTYHKLFIPFVQKIDTCDKGWHTLSGYAGCIRQDIGAKKVFMVFPNSSSESVLYDFNLNVGDTLRLPALGGWVGPVFKMDSMLIGSDYRKVWHIRQWIGLIDTILVEGMGFTAGPLTSYGNTHPDSWVLECFQQDASILYHPNTAVSCNINTSVNQLTSENTISVYPNPTSGTIIVSVNKNVKQGQVNVFNMLGEEVFSEPFIGKRKAIDLNIPSGIYFMQVTNGFETRVCRFIRE